MFIILDLQNISISPTLTIHRLVSKHSSTHKPPLPQLTLTNVPPQHKSPKQRSTQHPSNPQTSSLPNNPTNKSPFRSLPTSHTITQHTPLYPPSTLLLLPPQHKTPISHNNPATKV